jgi:hypothetical protein
MWGEALWKTCAGAWISSAASELKAIVLSLHPEP